MTKIKTVFGVCITGLVFASNARADEPTPVVPAPAPIGAPAPLAPTSGAPTLVAPAAAPAPVAPMPAPRPAPVYIPTADERAAAVRAATSDCTTCPDCAPCGREACFQTRDTCGWLTNACGARLGCLEIEIQGGASWTSNPDGMLGELVAGNTAPLDWNDLEYPLGIGGRAAVSYRYAPFHRVELRGAYYGDSDDSSTTSGFFGATPGATGTGDLSRPVTADFSTDATSWGAEFVWWNELACEGNWRYDWGIGARYLSFDETANVGFVATGPGPFPVANGFVHSDVTNDWYGLEGCFAVHLDLTQSFEISATFKALFGQLSSDASVTDDSIFAGGLHSASASDDNLVFGAELELGARWRLTDHISVSAAANMLFLDDVQRAEDVLDFSHSTTGAVQARNAPDQLVITSLYLGVVFTF